MRTKFVKYIIYVFLLILPTAVFTQSNSGWFKPYIIIDPGANAQGIAIGDVNNDGRDDLVVASGTSSNSAYDKQLLVYHQNSDGTLSNFLNYDIPGYTDEAVRIGDLNNDGRDDVLVLGNGELLIYYQNASGMLDAPTTVSSSGSNWMQLGDLDNDGILDAVGLNWIDTNVYVHYQTAGSLGAQVSYTLSNGGYPDIQVGDLNNDHLNDIMAASGQGLTNHIGVIYQLPGGGFSAPTYYSVTGLAPNGVGIGDLNGDGLNDLVAPRQMNADIFYQNLGGTFDAPVQLTLPTDTSGSMAEVDINRDGVKDFIISSYSSMMTLIESGGSFTIETYPFGKSSYNNYGMATGDINNDGMTDVVYACDWNGIAILYGWDGSPALSVIYPSRSSTLTTGDSVSIQWGSSNFTGNVTISYSTNGGSTWSIITSSTSNNGLYSWTVPLTPSTNCLIRVNNASGGIPQAESGRFGIASDGVDRLALTYPNGGETFAEGDTVDISWNSTGTITDVQLEYSTNGGGSWTDISPSTLNDGSFPWTIPDTASTSCMIRISDASDGTPADSTDGVFTIAAAGTEIINLTAPNGGQALTGGSSYTITWNSSGGIGAVAIHYSLDNGSTWATITGNTDNDGSYSWNVPNTPAAECLIRVQDASDSTPSDQSDSTFSITTSSGVTSSITVTLPNGGEKYYTGMSMPITWTSTGAVGDVQLQYSTNGGGSWTTISTHSNSGSYNWVVPDTPSTNCYVRVREASDSTPSDTSNAAFSIYEFSGGLFVKSPQNGDYFSIGAVHDITWTAPDGISKVKIEYSIDNRTTWTTIAAATGNDGKYSWTVPNKPSTTCNIRISDASDGDPVAISFGSFSIVSGAAVPEISLNRDRLNFTWVKSSLAWTPSQTVVIDNTGIGTLKWKATKETDALNDPGNWLVMGTTSGTQSSQIPVSINTTGLNVGTYSATVTFSDPNASNSPQTMKVYLTVKASGTDADPFGTFDTPGDNTTVMSSIPVTGWVLDDVGIDKVTIWRSGTASEGGGMIYIDDAILVDGARADVQASYPDYPQNYQAGWGYMMLTNGLPGGGNGIFTIYAYAKDVGGNQVLLGQKTIKCDNANAVKPFGAIDSPKQGGTANSTKYRCQGWALTPLPNQIPTDGSTIKLLIDGKFVANVHYNIYREDIERFFPGYKNSGGALGYYDFDTTAYDNGIHTIQWTATDNAGNTDGIGSRFFTIQNSGYTNSRSETTSAKPLNRKHTAKPLPRLSKIPANITSPIFIKTGYSQTGPMQKLNPSADGAIDLTVRQDDRMVMQVTLPGSHLAKAYLNVNGKSLPLPPGSSLDLRKGKFYWQIGPGIFGNYHLVFVSSAPDGALTKQTVRVAVKPKY